MRELVPVAPAFMRLPKRLILLISVCLDESGKHDGLNSPVVSFGGIIGNEGEWAKVRDQWCGLLDKAGLDSLTMKSALDYRKPLSKSVPAIGLNARIAILAPFVRCVREGIRGVISVSVDAIAFAELNGKVMSILKGDPHYLAFLGILAEVGAGGWTKNSDVISVICDDDESKSAHMLKLYRWIKKSSRDANARVISLSFSDDQMFPMLQAADVIASLSRLDVANRFHARNNDYSGLIDELMDRQPTDRLQNLQFFYHSRDNLKAKAKRLIEIRKAYGTLPLFDADLFSDFNKETI